MVITPPTNRVSEETESEVDREASLAIRSFHSLFALQSVAPLPHNGLLSVQGC
jgi:hypothetical protein